MTVKFNFEVPAETSSIFTDEANQFVESLHNKFSAKISELLQARASRQEDFNNGKLPDFLPSTKEVRSADWKVRDIPEELLDRRVEITGPVDRKMIINALIIIFRSTGPVISTLRSSSSSGISLTFQSADLTSFVDGKKSGSLPLLKSSWRLALA